MTDELNLLPKEEKKIAAKTLYRMGWGSYKIEQMLGISDNTVLRAVDEPTPEELKCFEAEFEKAIRAMKQEGIAIVQKRLLKLIPKEQKIDQVVKAGEYLEGKSGTSIAQQIKVILPHWAQ